MHPFQVAGDTGNSSIGAFGVVCVLGIIFGLILLALSIRVPIRDTRTQPRLVRYSFIFFIIALIIVGGGLVLKIPNILPWVITPEGSVLYGWMFLGAMVYFIYAVVRPSWGNSAGQLIGFLAYDVVLIIAFITRFQAPIPPEFLSGHILYTLVVSYSGLLAIYYLFINPSTRMIGARRASLQTA